MTSYIWGHMTYTASTAVADSAVLLASRFSMHKTVHGTLRVRETVSSRVSQSPGGRSPVLLPEVITWPCHCQQSTTEPNQLIQTRPPGPTDTSNVSETTYDTTTPHVTEWLTRSKHRCSQSPLYPTRHEYTYHLISYRSQPVTYAYICKLCKVVLTKKTLKTLKL